MRHATSEDLGAIDGLVSSLRELAGLTEKRPGVFYRRSKAFLHFHAHDGDLFADVRTDPGKDFERRRVTTKAEQRRLLAEIRRSLAPSAP
ncbi:MAG TPA: hypothetical protein VGZ03_00545 [Acidimicrobiales bacterium]|jgi:hypothetical protein|nr:hypothetical protein [Acidimicrobiales bacterium]